jgi:hypothetical protein
VSFLNWQPRVCEWKCWRKCLNWEESPSLNKFIASTFVSCFIQQLALIQCLFSVVFSGYILPNTWFISLHNHNIKIRFASCSWVKDINKPLVWFFILKKLGLPWQAYAFFSIGLWDVLVWAHIFSLDKAYVGSSIWADITILWDWVWIKIIHKFKIWKKQSALPICVLEYNLLPCAYLPKMDQELFCS